jgi:hypothetical protein
MWIDERTCIRKLKYGFQFVIETRLKTTEFHKPSYLLSDLETKGHFEKNVRYKMIVSSKNII